MSRIIIGAIVLLVIAVAFYMYTRSSQIVIAAPPLSNQVPTPVVVVPPPGGYIPMSRPVSEFYDPHVQPSTSPIPNSPPPVYDRPAPELPATPRVPRGPTPDQFPPPGNLLTVP